MRRGGEMPGTEGVEGAEKARWLLLWLVAGVWTGCLLLLQPLLLSRRKGVDRTFLTLDSTSTVYRM